MIQLAGPGEGVDDIFVETNLNGLSFARPAALGEAFIK